MQNTITMKSSFSNDFKHLINNHLYEELLLSILNKSIAVFPNKYEWKLEQSHGEPDFIDLVTKHKYDAKLVLSTEQGKLLGSRAGSLEHWFYLMTQEVDEIYKIVSREGTIQNTEFFKTINRLINKVTLDEHVILFFLYPFIIDGIGNDYFFYQDALDIVYDEIKRANLSTSREIYAIYPSIDGNIVLRRFSNGSREYVESNDFDKYFAYSIELD